MNNDNFLSVLNKKGCFSCLIKNKINNQYRIIYYTDVRISIIKNLLNRDLKGFEEVENVKDDNNYLLSNIFYK